MTNASLFTSPSLEKYLSRVTRNGSPLTSSGIAPVVLDMAKESRRDFLHVLQGFDSSLDMLDQAFQFTLDAIAILEEIGGLSVRARNMAQEQDGLQKYKEKLEEVEALHGKAVAKLDAHIEKSVSGDVNLLKGESVSTTFDQEGQSVLLTQGINLTSGSLGIRPADFSSLSSTQNARIDVANSMDLAVTLKNIISSDISTIRTRREFCESSLSSLTRIQDFLLDGGSVDEPVLYLDLCRSASFPAEGEVLADEPQMITLQNFKTP